MTTLQQYPGISNELHDAICAHLNNIVDWADKRNIVCGATPQAQFLKLVEEVGEFNNGLQTTDIDMALDGLGDTFVVATIIAAQLNVDDFHRRVMDALRSDANHEDPDEGAPFFVDGIGQVFADGDMMQPLARLAGALARNNKAGAASALTSLMRNAIEGYCAWFGSTINTKEFAEVDGEAELLDHALTLVWAEIKDRKGVVVDGVFIKSTDPQYGQALRRLGRFSEAAAHEGVQA